MKKIIQSPTLAETAFGLQAHNPVSRLLAGFTGFAAAVTLILATAIPVKAERPTAVCAQPIQTTAPAACKMN